MNMNRQTRQTGSLLIEAMISLLVLSVGIIALAELDSVIMRGGANAQARNMAVKLAQKKIDDLRAYNEVLADAGLVWPDSVAVPASRRPYEFIADVEGGSVMWPNTTTIDGDTWRTTRVGNTDYAMRWVVDNWNEGGILAPTSLDVATYKQVAMTVSWTNIEGDNEQLSLPAYIAKINNYGQKILNKGSLSAAGPLVEYIPGLAPEIISLDSDGELIETTLPEPAIKKLASVKYFYSQFSTVTYVGSVALREEEFLNINCQCDFPGGSAWKDEGFPVARVIWHPDHDKDTDTHTAMVVSLFHPDVDDHAFISQTGSSRADFLGNEIIKTIGEQAGGASSQHPFCDICCNDHHDTNKDFIADLNGNANGSIDSDEEEALVALYACDPTDDDVTDDNGQRANCVDPWRPSIDYITSTGDHRHYTSAAVEVTPSGTGTYIESCRLKRINGLFNVFQDWHLYSDTYAAAAQETFTAANQLSGYQQYIKNYVETATDLAGNVPLNYTTTTIVNPATSFFWPPASTVTYPITTRFIARGIYMDYLDPYTLRKVNELSGTSSFFENVAFSEINMTRLSRWRNSPNGASLTQCDEGNNAPLDISQTTDCVTDFDTNDVGTTGSVDELDRGEVRVNATVSDFNVKSNVLLGNTGFTTLTDDPMDEPTTPTAFITFPTSADLSFDPADVTYTTSIPGKDGLLN